MAARAPTLPNPLHARALLVDEPGRAVVLHPPAQTPHRAEFRGPRCARGAPACLHLRMERDGSPLRVDEQVVRQDPRPDRCRQRCRRWVEAGAGHLLAGRCTKYMAPQESIQDHAASAMAASILAMILSKDRAVQRKGCAWAFHSWMKARTRSSRVSRSAKLGAVMRLRCRTENHCSTWFIHEQCTGVKCI